MPRSSCAPTRSTPTASPTPWPAPSPMATASARTACAFTSLAPTCASAPSAARIRPWNPSARPCREGRFANETAEHYGLALALERQGDLEGATKEANALRAKLPQQAEMVVLQARLQRRRGDMPGALANLREAIGLAPTSWPLNMAYAEALTEAGRSADALKAMRVVRPPEAQRSRSVQAHVRCRRQVRGERRGPPLPRRVALIGGDLEPAIKQLEIGLHTPGLSYQAASRIQVRLDEFRDEYRDLKKAGEAVSNKR